MRTFTLKYLGIYKRKNIEEKIKTSHLILFNEQNVIKN